MPVMDGYEATKEIRKISKDVIIIAQTAFALAGDKEKSLEEAHNKASQEYDRIVSEADKKAGEKLEDAKAAAEKEHSQMIADAKDEIAGMVIEASDKMTASKADPETDHALFEKFISETKKKSQ